jgi:pimeloyl-ACP methyl ester carboxylesterase
MGSGPDVLIALHGFGASLDSWDDVADALASRQRVYLVDLMGFGRSDKPKHFRYTVREQADGIVALIEWIRRETQVRSLGLLGHSYGGSVSLETLILLRDRNEALVDRLVLIDALAYPKAVHFPWYIRALTIPILNRVTLNVLSPERQTRIVLKHVLYRQDLVVDRVCRYAPFLALPGARRALRETAGQLKDSNAAEEIGARLVQITIPVLIIWGAHDRLIPLSQSELLRQNLPNSRPPAVFETGHVPQEEDPAGTALAIRSFLSQ